MLRFIRRHLSRAASAARGPFRELSELDAYVLAGDGDCPVLDKEESAPQQAAVCLKRFPTGYVLGISDAQHDLKLWFTSDRAAARERFAMCVERMRRSGSPFGC